MLLLCLYSTTETIGNQAVLREKTPKKRQKNNNNYLMKLGNFTIKLKRQQDIVLHFTSNIIICD